MSEMIERVAEIISEGVGADQSSHHIARKVIEAMREPTEEMLAALGPAKSAARIGGRAAWSVMIDEALK